MAETQSVWPQQLIIASKNRGKIEELRPRLYAYGITMLRSLLDFKAIEDIPETGQTFAENAMIKAQAVVEATGLPTLADDSGLEVDALDGRPGIYSARYAGANASDTDRNQRILGELQGVAQSRRTARFYCSIVYVDPTAGLSKTFSGTCRGRILFEPQGDRGFGYDPIFWVDELNKSMAELTADEKNQISHRGRAVDAFFAWLSGERTPAKTPRRQ